MADAAWNGDTAVALRGRHFLILMQDVPDIPGYRIPVLHIGEPNEEGGIDFAPFEPLLRLFREETLSSITSKRHIARAVRLFIEYVDHRGPRLADIASSLRKTDVRRIFREFCVHIRTGTVDGTGPQTGTAALGWQPTSQGAARNLINGFDTFLNYVAEVTEPHRDMPGELGLPMGDDRLRNAHARAFGMMAHLRPSVPRKASDGPGDRRQRPPWGLPRLHQKVRVAAPGKFPDRGFARTSRHREVRRGPDGSLPAVDPGRRGDTGE